MRFTHSLTVISLGGGVQSSVMALMASQGAFDAIPNCAIFADTHWEPPSLYTHLDWLAERLGFPVYVVDNGRSLREDSSGPHHQDSGEAKIRESTAGVSRKPSSDGKARGCSSKHLCGLTAWNT